MRQYSIFLLLSLSLAGCSSEDGGGGSKPIVDNNTPLSDVDALFQDAPTNGKMDELGKADAVYPKQFFDLVQEQSPVRSQASRGVCSIFATVALMEHLYLKEGSTPNPDFSEQYLQWSVKSQHGAFTNTEGSNARSNLEAINKYGIPAEAAWPYQTTRWNASNDPDCAGGDSQPVKCYTNGEPPDSAKSAQQFFLPTGRWINSKEKSIKAHMTSKRQGAIVGLTFYYQAWNHGGSALRTSNELWRGGWVPAPNDKDKTESLKKRAGHAILLVGWDDDAEIQPIDAEGNPAVDANGDPIKEKGFFIFKNSWGTDRFGVDNPHGRGYGYISYKYVEQEGTVYASDLPKLEPAVEVCNDGKDNDHDGDADCADSDCSTDSACTGSGKTYSASPGAAIPDNSSSGVSSDIVVTDTGAISALSVSVDISHSYVGDLIVKLVRQGGGEIVLHERDGGSANDLKKTYSVTAFDGQDAAGTWTLVVADRAKTDTGTLNSWSLDITTCSGAGCGSAAQTYDNTTSQGIPDNDNTGISSDISVADAGAIKSLNVTVAIDHPAKGDLNVRLQKLGLTEVQLVEADASSGAFGTRTFSVPTFVGEESSGTWRLIVSDVAGGDLGTLQSWSMEIKR
ncbi:MAG: proprotein convertase P-domain-containing protein [Polyangiaceae bacterium]